MDTFPVQLGSDVPSSLRSSKPWPWTTHRWQLAMPPHGSVPARRPEGTVPTRTPPPSQGCLCPACGLVAEVNPRESHLQWTLNMPQSPLQGQVTQAAGPAPRRSHLAGSGLWPKILHLRFPADGDVLGTTIRERLV